MPENKFRTFSLVADDDDCGKRLDTLIASSFPEISRNSAAKLVRDALIRVNDSVKKPSYRVNASDLISGATPEVEPFHLHPEPLDIDILFENAACLVINKRPGIVVHPSCGHENGTLVNGLIYHRPEIEGVGGISTRSGIVHRLDKDTTGVLVIAKTEQAFGHLSLQFKERTIDKSYLGFVYGIMPAHGQVLLPIGRHATNRKKMSATEVGKSRDAQTYWTLLRQFYGIALINFTIKTGRTHQIRVHSAAIGHPIVGDPVYGVKRPGNFFPNSPRMAEIVKKVSRQLLHAWRLTFALPDTGEKISVEAPIPEDMLKFQNAITEIIPQSLRA